MRRYRLPDYRLLVVLLLGISSGFPLALSASGGTLQAWMTDFGFSTSQLGALVALTAPYSFKFLWAPLIDQYRAPIFGSRGQRRGWLVFTQALLALNMFVLGSITPQPQDWVFLVTLFSLAFLSATQDIVLDAYRIEIVPKEQYGIAASQSILGYRIGMLLSGAVALYLADRLPWPHIFLGAGLFQLLFCFLSYFAPAENRSTAERTLKAAVVEPFMALLRRPGFIEVVLFVIAFKLPDVIGTLFTTRFLLDMGFTKSDIAQAVKVLGVISLIFGASVGGYYLPKLGLKRGLLYFGVIQAITIGAFAVLTVVESNFYWMACAVALENFGSGLGTAAFAVFLMNYSEKRFAATHYAFLSSASTLSRVCLGGYAGKLVEAIGWGSYFCVSMSLAIPALLLVLWRFERWELPKDSSST